MLSTPEVDADGWTWVQRERSDSLRSTASSYSWHSSWDGEDVARGRGELAAALEAAEGEYFGTPKRQRVSFFSASGAPVEVQLRVATSVTCLSDLNALHATCKWTRMRQWQAVTATAFAGRAARVESLPLAEAAAATLVVRYLGFEACLPATQTTEAHAKRLSLATAAVVIPPRHGAALVASSPRKACAVAHDGVVRSDFDTYAALRDAATTRVLGLVSLRGPPPGQPAWPAYVRELAPNGCCRLAFLEAFEGWVKINHVYRFPFPVHPLEKVVKCSGRVVWRRVGRVGVLEERPHGVLDLGSIPALDRAKWATLKLTTFPDGLCAHPCSLTADLHNDAACHQRQHVTDALSTLDLRDTGGVVLS